MKPDPSSFKPAARRKEVSLPGDKDKLAGFVEISANILERQRAQAAVLEARRYLRGALDVLPQQIAILDEQGRVLEVNAAWKRELGNSPIVCRESESFPEHCLTLGEELLPLAKPLAQGIQNVSNGLRSEFQMEFSVGNNKPESWFALRVSRFEGKGPTRTVVALEDITPRKLLEWELAEARQMR